MIEYDRLAADYSCHRVCHPKVLAELELAVAPTHRVLELGCGTGNYLAAVSDRTAAVCWGIDPSELMLNAARVKGSALTLLLARAEAIPLASSVFDLVFSVDVVHHVANRESYFREAYRILKPGGRFCTVTDSEEIIRNRRPLALYFPETIEVELRRYPPIAELERLATSAGFEGCRASRVAMDSELSTADAYEARAFSSLHLISESAFAAGMERLRLDLERGPIRQTSAYVLLWASKPREGPRGQPSA